MRWRNPLFAIGAALVLSGCAPPRGEDITLLHPATTHPTTDREFPSRWFWGLPHDRASQDQLLGHPMPPLHLSDWIGEPQDLQGHVIVLDFWATWCPPCIELIPFNNTLHDKYAKDGLLLIGVCSSPRGQDAMPDFAREHHIRYPLARDPASRSADTWRITTWPTYAIIDRAGRIRAIGVQRPYVERIVQRLLSEPCCLPAGAGL